MQSEHNPRQAEESPYEYQKLSDNSDCIRILFVHPGSPNDELLCSLVEDNLSRQSKCPYVALSWCWGDQSSRTRLLIDQDSSGRAFRLVSSNLIEAIQHLRQPNELLAIWVDALCINQDDPHEKSIQIPMMSRIYRRAEIVAIWLGPGNWQTDLGMAALKDMLERGNSEYLAVLAPDKARAVLEILQRPWFLRRWILQEVFFAKEALLYCGSTFLVWEDFVNAVTLLRMVRTARSKYGNDSSRDWLDTATELGASVMIEKYQSIFRQSSNGHRLPLHTLESLVYECQYFQNSNPRDTIYALLAIASDSIETGSTRIPAWDLCIPIHVYPEQASGHYQVNYNQSYTGHCIDFVRFVIEQSRKQDRRRALDVLCRPWATAPSNVNEDDVPLPSWIPLVSDAAFGMFHLTNGHYKTQRINADVLVGAPSSRRSNEHLRGTEYLPYAACGKHPVDENTLRIFNGPHIHAIHTTGFIVDEVSLMEVQSIRGVIPTDWIRAAGCDFKSGDLHQFAQSNPDEFWKTIVADRGIAGRVLPRYYERAFKELFRTASIDTGGIDVLKPDNHDTNVFVSEFCQRVQAVIWNRVLMRTKKGRLGLVKRPVQEKDLICILYGCSVPVILRKHSATDLEQRAHAAEEEISSETYAATHSEKTYYEFLGECYVHGIMDGEAIDQQQALNIRTEIFDIR